MSIYVPYITLPLHYLRRLVYVVTYSVSHVRSALSHTHISITKTPRLGGVSYALRYIHSFRSPPSPLTHAHTQFDNVNSCLHVLRSNAVCGLDSITPSDICAGRLKAVLALFFALSRFKQAAKQTNVVGGKQPPATANSNDSSSDCAAHQQQQQQQHLQHQQQVQQQHHHQQLLQQQHQHHLLQQQQQQQQQQALAACNGIGVSASPTTIDMTQR